MSWFEWLIFFAIVLMILGVLEAGIVISRSGVVIGKPGYKRQGARIR